MSNSPVASTAAVSAAAGSFRTAAHLAPAAAPMVNASMIAACPASPTTIHTTTRKTDAADSSNTAPSPSSTC